MSAKLIVGVDVGGTKIAGGLVDRKGHPVKSQIVPTHAEKGFEASFKQISQLINHLIRTA